MNFPVFQNLGWMCPKCGSCYAPTIPQCFKCPIQNVQTTTDDWKARLAVEELEKALAEDEKA